MAEKRLFPFFIATFNRREIGSTKLIPIQKSIEKSTAHAFTKHLQH